MEGIDINDREMDKLMASMIKRQKEIEDDDRSKMKNDDDALDLVDEAYSIADYFTRMFVILNSDRIPNNFFEPETVRERELKIINRKRKAIKRPPILETRPIIIDRTRLSRRLLNESPFKLLSDFLGKVTIRQSQLIRRPDGTLWIRKRDGKSWFRKEHPRRTRSPGDRTNAPYLMVAGNPEANLVIDDPTRPPQLRIDTAVPSEIKKGQTPS